MDPKKMDMDLLEKLSKKRIVVLPGVINQDKINILRRIMANLCLESHDEITLIIDSKGGSTKSSFFFYDFLKIISSPVIGVVNGECQSAAMTILQGCTRRISTKHSRFLIHNNTHIPEMHLTSNVKEHYDIAYKEMQSIQDQLIHILMSRSQKTREEITALLDEGTKFNKEYTAEEVLEMGFLDEIIEKACIL